MDFEKLPRNRFVQLLIIAFIATVFVAPPEALLQDDLDSAVRWASAHLFSLGSGNFYLYPHTNGPLFFLKFPIPGNNTILLSAMFDFATKVILGFYLVLLSAFFRPYKNWLPLGMFVLFCSLFYLDFIIIGITLATSLIAFQSKNIVQLIPGIAIIIVSIFIKASISFPALFIFGSAILILLIRKEVAFSLKLVGIFLAGFLVLTLILYGNLFQSLSWIFSAFIATLSYGDDQSIHFNNTWPLVLFTVLSVLAIPIFIRNKQTQNFMFIAALAIFSIWKYSLGREDFTHYRAWYYLCILMACFIVLLNKKKDAIIGFACFFMSLTFFATNTSIVAPYKIMAFKLPRIDYFPRVILRGENINNEVRSESLHTMRRSKLTDSMVQKIGNSTVDVFPWGLAILYKYNLNYQPRPGFHSTLLGQEADAHEGLYFKSKKAPAYLLWHNAEPFRYGLNGHDQVYLPNAVPHTFQSLLQNYSLQQYENGYALWKRTASKKFISKAPVTMVVKFNEWFDVPKMDSNIISFASTNIEMTAMQQVIAFLYKGPFFKIVYRLENGENVSHYVSLKSLQQNFLVQPYFTNPAMESLHVRQLFIKSMDKIYHDQPIEITFKKSILKSANSL